MSDFIEREFNVLAPSNMSLVISAVAYRSEHYQLDLFNRFNVQIPDTIGYFAAKRCSDYLAGRLAAKAAICHFLQCSEEQCGNFQVKSNHVRLPLFPPQFVGSISHTSNLALAAVANCGSIKSIGIDIEQLISEDSYESVKKQVLTNNEIVRLSQFPLSKLATLTLIFSAKESLFKCLYPQVNRFFDFNTAMVTSIEPAQGKGSDWFCFKIQLLESLNARCIQGLTLTGFYRMHLGNIITLIATN